MSRLPPNQQLVAPGKWPLVGEKRPALSAEPWCVNICGLVESPGVWSLEALKRLPQVEREIDIHCVTRWSKLGAHFGGVLLTTLLEQHRPLAKARFLTFTARSERSHSTSLPLDDALELGVLVALTYNGAPLSSDHGGPVRVVTPGRYFYKSLKWLETVELRENDTPGYWEANAGYHNHADPWLEERFIAPALDRREVRKLLETRQFGGRDLRGIEAAGRELEGLDARRALLRDADFRRAHLAGARFDAANLSGARLQEADLRGASFAGADVEGADLRGADLRGADFTGASLFGASFCPFGADEAYGEARLDRTTVIEQQALEALTPEQRTFLEASLQAEPIQEPRQS